MRARGSDDSDRSVVDVKFFVLLKGLTKRMESVPDEILKRACVREVSEPPPLKLV